MRGIKGGFLLALTLFGAPGCSQTLLKGPTQAISGGTSTLQAALIEQDRDTRLARVRVAGLLTTSADRTSFIEYVCAGDGYLAAQKAALAGLSGVTGAVDAAYASPPKDLAELASRQWQRWQLAGRPSGGSKPPSNAPAPRLLDEEQIRADCKTLVDQDLGPSPRFAPAAILGIIAAAGPVIDGVKALAIKLLQYEDGRAREEELMTYLKAPTTEELVARALGPCAIRTELKTDDDIAKCVASDPDSQKAPLSAEQVLDIIGDKRRAALTVPFTRWRVVAAGRDGDVRTRMVLANAQLHSDLADYDELRRRPVSAALQVNMVKGFRTMHRIAKGDLTSTEREKMWREGVIQFVTAVIDVGTAMNGLADPVDKLDKAIGKATK